MKAIILATDQGYRLSPATLTKSKFLLPIANREMILYVLDNLHNARITDICIVINDKYSSIIEFINQSNIKDTNITYLVQKQYLGHAHAIGLCDEFVGNESFIVMRADTIFQENLSSVIDKFKNTTLDAMVILKRVTGDMYRYQLAVVENEMLSRFPQMYATPPSNLAIAEIYLLKPSIFEAIDRTQLSARGEYEITDSLEIIAWEKKSVGFHILDDKNHHLKIH